MTDTHRSPLLFFACGAHFYCRLAALAPNSDPCSDAHPRQPLRVVASQSIGEWRTLRSALHYPQHAAAASAPRPPGGLQSFASGPVVVACGFSTLFLSLSAESVHCSYLGFMTTRTPTRSRCIEALDDPFRVVPCGCVIALCIQHVCACESTRVGRVRPAYDTRRRNARST